MKTKDQIIKETRDFFQKVYGWMFLGLIISGVTAYIIGSSPALYEPILGNQLAFMSIIIIELALVFGLIGRIKKISANRAIVMFLLYSFTTGLTLSVVFLLYTIQSIGLIFFISAGMFGAMSVYGYYTKKDLTHMGQIAIMGLFGLIIASIINFFLKSTMANYILSCIGVLVFTGLTAYDTQKIRQMNIIGDEGSEEDTKESIMGALKLYLDFVNLFLELLRLFGRKK